MAKKAKNARKDLLGPDNEETLRSSEMIGLAYNLGDQRKKAEELQVQVMEIHKRVLGLEHPDALTSMANLAPTLMSSGQDKAALQVIDECARLRSHQLGPDHPEMPLEQALPMNPSMATETTWSPLLGKPYDFGFSHEGNRRPTGISC